ncbi:heparinase II/III family protein [Achromobacter insuavis]
MRFEIKIKKAIKAMTRFDSVSLERDLESFEGFSYESRNLVTESDHGDWCRFSFGTCHVRNGVPKVQPKSLRVEYAGGSGIEGFDVRLVLDTSRLASGLGGEVRLSGWESVNAISIGYTQNDIVTNIKVRKVALDNWFFIEFDHSDIAFELEHSWKKKSASQINDIRIYIYGKPGESGASVEIREMYTWLQKSSLPSWLNASSNSSLSSSDAMARLWIYQERCFGARKRFELESECPIAYGKAVMPWPLLDARPAAMGESVSYQYSWHAWHPVMSMLWKYCSKQEDVYLYSAQDFAAEWLHSSYSNIDPNGKYCWYDHGVAERLIAMVMLYETLSQRCWAPRFLAKLRGSIYRHAQLISSEAFYAYTQDYRYHNHAWFQDLSLMVTASVMKWFPCAQDWMGGAVRRLEDQLRHLVEIDGDLHIFIENSIGYHDGMIAILELISDVVNKSGIVSEVLISTVIGMKKFSEFMMYPDGRLPSFGDTYRVPNMKEVPGAGTPQEVGLTILKNAGYAVMKGRHADVPYSVVAIASSLSATHKHEDNASFSLFFDGVEWLIDPSYYSHDYSNPIPAYLRSALAHNAVAVPGLPYSLDPHHSDISGQQYPDGSCQIDISHRCYQGVRVDRTIKGSLAAMEIRISDRLSVGAPSEYLAAHFMFHCGEGVVATRTDRGVVLSHESSKRRIIIRSRQGEAIISAGVLSEDPVNIRGIVSHDLMEMENIYVVEYKMPLDDMEMNFDISVLEG